jgi:hypothetical protein
MRQSTLILSILATTVCASDVVSFFFPGGSSPVVFLVPCYPNRPTLTLLTTGFDGVEPVATLKTVNPTMTEFHIACPTPSDTANCGWGPGLDATILSQTRYEATMDADSMSVSMGCDYNTKKLDMTCTVNQEGGKYDTGGEPVTAVFSEPNVRFLSLSVVAGNSLLRTESSTIPSASAATTKTSAQSTAVVTSARSASTGLMTVSETVSATGSTVSSSSIAATPTPSKSSATVPESTGAAARFGIEGSALLMLAGAAAMNVW